MKKIKIVFIILVGSSLSAKGQTKELTHHSAEYSTRSISLSCGDYGFPMFRSSCDDVVRPAFINWSFDLNKSGIYKIVGEHTSTEYRPMQLRIDGNLLTSNAFNQVTGSWKKVNVKEYVMISKVYLEAGHHKLSISRSSSMPHVNKIKLVFVQEMKAENELGTVKLK